MLSTNNCLREQLNINGRTEPPTKKWDYSLLLLQKKEKKRKGERERKKMFFLGVTFWCRLKENSFCVSSFDQQRALTCCDFPIHAAWENNKEAEDPNQHKVCLPTCLSLSYSSAYTAVGTRQWGNKQLFGYYHLSRPS